MLYLYIYLESLNMAKLTNLFKLIYSLNTIQN